MTEDMFVPPMEETHAELERRLIDEYLRSVGESTDALRGREDARARKLRSAASTYATSRLAEVEARSHYVRRLHGQE
jgi:hypothetical protein